MKKRSMALILALVLCLAFALSACGGEDATTQTQAPSNGESTGNEENVADDTVYTFKIDYPNPENSAGYVALTEWSDMLREQSGGRLDFQIYANGQLGSIMDCVSNCVGGVTDGFWSALTLYAGSFRAAVDMARDMAHEGENVLLSPACASFDMFQDFEQRGRVFKQIVAEYAGN